MYLMKSAFSLAILFDEKIATMAPTIEDRRVPGAHNTGKDGSPAANPEAVVISGISTLMPGSHNVKEFADKLYDKENLVKCSNPRWKYKSPELAQYHGLVPNVDRFDAQFFMVYHRLSHVVDAMARKLLEQSYQAVYDAGISPSELSGKSIGVFVATGHCESEKACASDMYLTITGCNRAMFANRISYYLNLKGPSMLMDADSAGSAVALEKAHASIMSGQCEAAIVGGTKLLLHPQTSLHYHKLIPMSKDGIVKSYDMNADGHSISEAVTVIFLQKYKDAKRVYASIRHVKTSFSAYTNRGEHQKYGFYREPAMLTKFLREFYDQAKVSPSDVEYIEGYGSGIPDADKAELEAIDAVFCKDRTKSVPVGSVLSNVGFTDAVTCLTSITKLLIAYQTGSLAANFNYKTPRMDIPAIAEGRIRILSEHEQFGRGLAAINNFSITGINAHVLLEGIFKPKVLSKLHSKLPQLLMVSGRQESAVQKILDDIKSHPMDPEEIALLTNIHKTRIPKHLARGFAIYTTDKEHKIETLKEEVDYYDDARRPLCFVYSGIGSQWAGMGAQLMKIPVFADAINRCHKALEPKGIDLIHVITASDKVLFENILNSFVGIAAVQIGLTNILQAIGLVPDIIIGHSVGELGCAYADGCLTAEEMILMAYSRGRVSIQTPFIKGSMAAVGIGFKQISKILPPEIEVACHNGPESSTISGPADKMKEFVAQLTAQGIFAKEVPCSNIAYHSKYIAEAGPGLLRYLRKVVNTPRARSERWLSTSVPKDKWNEPLAKFSSAEYHTNNLLSPVLFEETLRLLPSNSVLVEIAPHGLLQAILKRSLSADCKHIPLTKRGHADGALFLLEAIGKLYMEGYDIDVSPLYPKIEFPVSSETRSLSPLVEWMYSEKLKVCQYSCAARKTVSVYKPIISLYDEEYQYLSGNVINDKKVFPVSVAILLVWETLAMVLGRSREQVTVQFKDVHIHVQPPLFDDKSMPLIVSWQRGSGRFEVSHDRNLVVTGNVIAISQITDLLYLTAEDLGNHPLKLTENDIYKLLYEKGYQYENEFRSIQKANISLTRADITWNNNWVTFIDAALQFNVLRRDHKGISQPMYIKRLCIDVKQHTLDVTGSKHRNGAIEAVYSEVHDSFRCGGLTVEHVTFRDKPMLLRQYPAMKELTFVPFNDEKIDIMTSLYIFLQIVVENLNENDLFVHYISDTGKPYMFEKIKHLLNSSPEIKLNIAFIKSSEIMQRHKDCLKSDLVFLDNVIHNKKVFEDLYHALPPNTFIINHGEELETLYPSSLYHVICTRRSQTKRLELSKWRPIKSTKTTAAFSVKNEFDLGHLQAMKSEITGQQRLLVLAPYPSLPGLKELVKQWRSDAKDVYLLEVNDTYYDDDGIDFPSLDLVFNILKNGTWGGEYFVPLKEDVKTSTRNIALQIKQFGNLDSLQWIDNPGYFGEGMPVKVHYAGLNLYDAKRAIAEISIKNSTNRGLGMDFSGVTDRGDRVMGLIRNGAVSGQVVAQPEFLWPVPKHWTLEDAATVPLPYCLAFYCLAIKAKLQRGMNVLVHGGAGALGQAAISICLVHHCNVFTTVSDVHKKRFLRKLFPNLPADSIGSSRDTSFVDMVIKETKGEGCHVIITSVSGEIKQATLRCCAPSGITLDTVLLQNQENFTYGMFNMTKSRSFAMIDFASIFEYQNLKEMKDLQRMISEGIAQGYVQPLTRVTYPPQEVARSIRLLTASRHRGRVLLNLLEPVPVVRSRFSCSPNTSHLILCDREDFGLQLADRLINNGAKKLYIHRPQPTPILEYKQITWKKQGIQVQVTSQSLKKKENVFNLLKNGNRIAPIEGIYIVKDEKANVSKFQSLVRDLDLVSRELCPEVRHFAIIHDDGEIQNILSDRFQNGYPALSLRLHNTNKFNINKEANDKSKDNALKWQTALDSIESALSSKKPILFAYAQLIRQKSLLEEFSRITGVQIELHQADQTLEQIGIDNGKAQEIRNIMEENYNIVMTKETALQMTISELQELQDDLTKVKEEFSGLKGFFNYIEPDELLANCNVVLMRTLIHSSELRADEFDSELTYLCIVPGLEGSYRRFSTICERLKLPALVLQPGFDVVNETVKDMAERHVKSMTTKLVLRNHFYLLGYEYGILVALEMASQLEGLGFTGTIYCLGGTPEDICATIEKQFGDIVPEKLENQFIGHIYALITGRESEELAVALQNTKNWVDKVAQCINLIRGMHPYTNGYVRAILNAYYTRIIKAREYNMRNLKLRSKIVVLRSQLPFDTEDSSAVYDTIHELNATLSHVCEDSRCSAIVNKYLEPDILVNYYNGNRCESSLVNEDDEVAFNYIDD